MEMTRMEQMIKLVIKIILRKLILDFMILSFKPLGQNSELLKFRALRPKST